MKKSIIVILLILVSAISRGGVTHTSYAVPNYGTCNIAYYIPDGSTGKLPAVVFIPGLGEQTSNIADLYVNGPLHFIQAGWKPAFIVIGIQPCFGWPGNNFTYPMLQHLIRDASFRVDSTRMYLTGFSAGANAIYDYVLHQVSSPVKLAAIVALSYAVSGSCLSNPTDYFSNYLCAADEPWHYLPYWGLCGTWDSFYGRQKTHYDQMKAAGWPNKQWTDMYYPDGSLMSHCCWNNFYDPAWKQSGKSIYDWMMQFSTTTAPVSTTLPVKLLSFDAYDQRVSVLLKWKVASEINFAFYQVERSSDGSAFRPIARIAATGSSDYNYNDQEPLNGTSYYRLRMVDYDGRFTFSSIKMVITTSETVDIEVYGVLGNLLGRYPGTSIREVKKKYEKARVGVYVMKITGANGFYTAQKFSIN
jgi:hypothetical protein